ALLGLHERADEVAELLVLGHPLAGARQDDVGDLGLATQQCDVSVVLRRTGRALAREALALGELATLEPRARETKERVPPERRAVLPELGFRFGELFDRGVEASREPIREADGVRGPRRFGR